MAKTESVEVRLARLEDTLQGHIDLAKATYVTADEYHTGLVEDARIYVTGAQYETRHSDLIKRVDTADEALEKRILRLEEWRQRMIGRYIVYAAIGAIGLATLSAFITHLVST